MSKDWFTQWKQEENAPFTGWDFSYLRGRYEEEMLPWCYEEKVKAFLKPQVKLLDMDTGGGEFLLSLQHPYSLTAVTESYPPNVEHCQKWLAPLGIQVVKADSGGILPFAENQFDVVINRHGAYQIEEIKRVLKPNGFFITQQVGGSNARELSSFLCDHFNPQFPRHNLENESQRFTQAGFRLMYQNQSYPKIRFFDVGALCYYVKRIPWEYPGFSVENAYEKLLRLQDRIEKYGKIEATSHRFIIIAKNQKNTKKEHGIE